VANPKAITLHAAGAETITGTGAAVDVEAIRSPGAVRLQLDVTAVAGTLPTLTVTIETSPSGGASGWRALGSFTVFTAAANFPRKTFAETERYVRASWVITGSAGQSFTFSLLGEAHQLYCAPSDISRYALPSAALASVAADVQADACLRATDDAEAGIAGGYTMPITAWPEALRGRVADVAAFYAMKYRGFNPEGSDELIVKANDDAQAWFKAVGQGRIKPPGLVDSSPTVFEAASHVVVSAVRRGW
jgi:phage gp36-like protein